MLLWRQYSTGLIVAGVVALVAAVGASKATAGCGDHVRVGGESAKPAAPMSHGDSKPPIAPCSGPECSTQPFAPAPAPATAPSEWIERMVHLAPVPANDPMTSCRFAGTDGTSNALHLASTIYRPPR